LHDLVIRNATIITAEGRRYGNLAVDGERIAAIGDHLSGREIIDAAGCYLIPGGVDQHVHLQMPLAGRVSTDTFATGSTAAALGGTTTVIDFVTPAPGEEMLAALASRRSEADGTVAVDYALHMTIPTWHGAEAGQLREILAVIEAGCSTFKMYQAYAGMVLDDAALYRAMKAVGAAGGSVVLHSEPGPLLDALRADALAAGRTGPIEHERTRPAALEATAVARAAQIAHHAKCPTLVFHVGCKESVMAIAEAQRMGIDLWGESCPHYLLLTAEEHLGGSDGARYICAPPLRHSDDQDVLWRALADGVLQVISTDHCPWTLAEKAQPDFAQVPGGVPGIEARLALLHHFGVNRGRISLEQWVALCCTNPARRMGLARKGEIAVGMDADLVIFDPARGVILSRQGDTPTLHEAADWTPYESMQVRGWPRTVLLRGRAIVQEGTYTGSLNDGRFIARQGRQ
jgi:dihydropyrimidinase